MFILTKKMQKKHKNWVAVKLDFENIICYYIK